MCTFLTFQIKMLESKYAGARIESRDAERKLKSQLDSLQRKLTMAEKDLVSTRIELTTCRTKLAETKQQVEQRRAVQNANEGEIMARSDRLENTGADGRFSVTGGTIRNVYGE